MGAASTPGFWDWSLDPSLALLAATAILYWAGSRRTVTPARTRRGQRWGAISFYTGLVVLAIALSSPLEALGQKAFWAHMVQHVLLLVVAPPLLVLARPWSRLWRALPLRTRRDVGRAFVQGTRAWPLRRLARALGSPIPSFVLFSVVLLAWHLPPLFDATLRSSELHALEHSLFFVTALMLWKQIIDSPPLRSPLTSPQRLGYVVGAMVVSWMLAVVLALAPHPLYATYAHEATRPGGISAIADQQLAAGIMWVPGSISFLIVVFVYVHRWLTPPSIRTQHSRLAGEH
ncbi:MAG TPA: cytochrome c oxidase assembly protein [Solirubrobacteraceae bacterium]|nr:cytochrome c oxidase assembly protein [Solirubrobacteraceae bacterium]